ncbi:MAG: fibronectin type III domain-containing protein [Bacteroidota bacterium]
MPRKIIAFAFFTVLFAAHTIAALPWNRLVPAVSVNENNEVVVVWETVNPTARAAVFYAPEDGSYRQPFPHYYLRATEPSVGRSHSIVLPNIEPGLLYNFRAACFDTTNLAEVRSTNYTFRVLQRNGRLELGIVLVEGPLVANGTTSNTVVAWKTNLPSDGEVRYWDGKSKTPTAVKAPKATTSFEVLLSNLSPDRQYFYQVLSTSSALRDSLTSPVYSFHTAPDARQAGTFKFVVYGDSRGGREPDVDHRLNGVNYLVLNRLVNLAHTSGARFILQTGDLIGGDTPDREDGILQYETHKKAIARVNAFIPFYHSVGNHDARTPHVKFGRRGLYDPPSPNSAEELWAEMLVLPTNGPQPEEGHPPYRENVYAFDYGPVHFVALNTDYFFVRHDSVKYKYDGFENRIAGRQRAWLIEDLKKAGDKLKVVYFHASPYPAGGHVGSALDQFPAERDSLWKIFEAYGVDLVFAGHEHNYSRVKVDSTINPSFRRTIYQIITGGAGAPTYAQDTTVAYLDNVVVFKRAYHYVLVTVDGKKIRVEAFNDSNEKFDELVIDTARR